MNQQKKNFLIGGCGIILLIISYLVYKKGYDLGLLIGLAGLLFAFVALIPQKKEQKTPLPPFRKNESKITGKKNTVNQKKGVNFSDIKGNDNDVSQGGGSNSSEIDGDGNNVTQE